MASLTKRDRTLLLVLLVLVILGLGLLFVHQASTVRDNLTASIDDASGLQRALVDGDETAARQHLDDLQRHSAHAHDTSSGALWSLASLAPGVGDDVDAVRRASSALHRVADQGLPPLVNAIDHGALQRIGPHHGHVDLRALQRLRRPVRTALASFRTADREIADVDTGSLTDPVRDGLVKAQRRLAGAVHDLTGADKALTVLPPMLGADGPRHYLLLFQNNAELRASGGIPGAFAEVDVRHGTLSLGRQGSAADFPEYDDPVLPLTDEEKKLFGGQLMGTYFQDTNFTPDFPRSAQLAREMYRREFDRQVDGVFSMDPVALSQVLAATGPITLHDGTKLTSDNAVQTLVNQPYFRLSDPHQQDAFFASAARSVFTALTAGRAEPAQLVNTLGAAVSERRVLLWSAHQREEQAVADTPVAGDLPTGDQARTSLGVYLQDATGSKLDYYLDYHLDVQPSCQAHRSQAYDATLSMQSNAPVTRKLLPPHITGGGHYGTKAGSTLSLVRLYGPTGGSVSDVKFNGRKVDTHAYTHEGRPVLLVVVLLEPGEKIDVTYHAETADHADGATRVRLTPGPHPGPTTLDLDPACP